MSVSKYQMFLKTVECGSFSRAAEELNFTQSGVSHAVQALEDELGITLLSRNRGGVVLTADGRTLLPRVEALCAAHHALMQSAADLKGLDAGLVKVATFSSVSAQWLPSILKSFGDIYPNIEFEVVDADFYGQTEEWILQGKVDCGFLRLPSAKSLCAHPLYRDELLVVVPCGHQLADAAAFPLSALSAEPFIRLEEGRDYELTAALDAMGVHPNVKYTTDGGAPAYAHGGTENAVAGLTISRLTPGDLANLKEPDVTCELLSDEDMEKIFQFKEEKQNETV